MLAVMYINPIFWLIALVMVLLWVRFITWVDEDLRNLPKQPEMLWKSINLSVMFLLLVVFVAVPEFFIALAVAIVMVGAVIGWYWAVRVQELGPAGHLFTAQHLGMNSFAGAREERRLAKQITLSYWRNGKPIDIPAADDPMSPGITLADQIIIQAVDRRAEAIWLVPSPNAYDLRFYVDGVAFAQPAMQRASAEPVVQGLKHLAGLQVDERRRPQEGQFTARDAERSTTWTVRSSGTTAGERLIMTADEQKQWRLPLDQIGLAAEQLATLKTLTSDTAGLVIVSSPPHSGATTTAYSLIRSHDAFTNSIQTLETNPRADLEGVTITRFQKRAGDSSFAKSLQSMFLQDPNIVLVGECPDNPTAEAIAKFTAAGHRVYLKMAAADTMQALQQWVKLVGNAQVASRGLRAVISERLPRLLCPTCKIAFQPDEATLRRLNLPIGRNLQCFKVNTEGVTDPKGQRVACPDCQSVGYRGRTGIFEILIISDDIRQAVASGASLEQIKALARRDNMMLVVEHGIRKFASGITSMQEVLRVCGMEKQPQKAAAPPPNPNPAEAGAARASTPAGAATPRKK